jgi:small subunit ribosomal protein S17
MADATVQGNKNEKIGQVVSTRMNKTIVLEVTRRVSHPHYKRVVTRKKKFYAHDEENSARVGDLVRVVECRPLSRLKRWRLEEIVRRAPQLEAAGENTEPAAEGRAQEKQSSKRQ